MPASNNSIIGHTYAGVATISVANGDLNVTGNLKAAVTVKLLSQASEVVSTPMVMPPDSAGADMFSTLEPFSPSIPAARVLEEIREKLYPGFKLTRIGMIRHEEAAPPEYLDFYVLDGGGIFIMRTVTPEFVAEFVGDYEIVVVASRGGDELPAGGIV